MSAPAVHVHDVVQTTDGQLHTVVSAPTDGPVLVSDWTSAHPRTVGGYRVLYRHHPRSTR